MTQIGLPISLMVTITKWGGGVHLKDPQYGTLGEGTHYVSEIPR